MPLTGEQESGDPDWSRTCGGPPARGGQPLLPPHALRRHRRHSGGFHSQPSGKPLFRNHVFSVWIRIRGSMPLTNGSGSGL